MRLRSLSSLLSLGPRCRHAGVAVLTLLTLAAGVGPVSAGKPKLTGARIVWWEDDRRPTPEPVERDPNLYQDMFRTTFIYPVGRTFELSTNVRRIGRLLGDGQTWPEASNLNSVDETPNSTWFTNRIGLFPMTPEEVAQGAGGSPPSPDGPWTIVRAKTEGVTPGFTIRDTYDRTYLIKFDPPDFPRMSSGAGVIVARLFHSAGYNVPQDFAIRLHRDNLVIKEGVKIEVHGEKVPMTDEHVDEMLARVARAPDGAYWAIASKYLDGTPIGPFNYRGRRKDDPNDVVDHQHRRELRGLGVIAGWVNHYDSKQANSLDMWVQEQGHGFVKHYLIDFASTLGGGAGADGPQPKHGMEFGVDAPDISGRLLAVGFKQDAWRRLTLPEGLPEVGYWHSNEYDPEDFEPLMPNTAFAMRTDRDGYWAAKIISAFRDEHILAACGQGDYLDPAATVFVARILAERRDMIARRWFERICPIDFFRRDGDFLVGTDLGVERGIWTEQQTRYRVRVRPVDHNRRTLSLADWRLVEEPKVGILPGSNELLSFEFQVDRGEGWSRSVTVYWARESGRVVEVAR